MHNPILGIYELKRFMGLNDLPRSDERIARVLRYFDSNDKEMLVDMDKSRLKFWEKLWCTYSDCVFVDLNAHRQRHQFFVRGVGVNETVKSVNIQLDFRLKVQNPLGLVENQITDTYDYMGPVLERLVTGTIKDGALMSANQFEALIRRNIYSSQLVKEYFHLSDLSVEISFSSEKETVLDSNFGCSIENDMNALLRIAKASDLDKGEEERLKKLLFNNPTVQ